VQRHLKKPCCALQDNRKNMEKPFKRKGYRHEISMGLSRNEVLPKKKHNTVLLQNCDNPRWFWVPQK
jgi:hypothetical protein